MWRQRQPHWTRAVHLRRDALGCLQGDPSNPSDPTAFAFYGDLGKRTSSRTSVVTGNSSGQTELYAVIPHGLIAASRPRQDVLQRPADRTWRIRGGQVAYHCDRRYQCYGEYSLDGQVTAGQFRVSVSASI